MGRGGVMGAAREAVEGGDEAVDLLKAVRRRQGDAQARAPLGTVGGRIAGTTDASASRARETARARGCRRSPPAGWGVGGQQLPAGEARPALKRAIRGVEVGTAGVACSMRSRAVSRVWAMSGGAPVVKM